MGDCAFRSQWVSSFAYITFEAYIPPMTALSQSWLLEAKFNNRLSENQLLASLNFPVFGDL
jgi:hypothetical protein